MAVLMAIGRFFKKIWDWIKQTAWIQPLLIVGLIFGVITSIRPIVNAAKSHRAKQGTYDTFYHNYRLSLSGADERKSEADAFTDDLFEVMLGTKSVEDFKTTYGDKCGNKFFVAYVARECSECDAAKDGFVAFKERLNNLNEYTASTDDPFKMVTIFGDEEKYSDSKPEETPFYHYCSNHSDFWETVSGYAESTDHWNSGGETFQNNIEKLQEGDNTVILTPTVFLVELDVPDPGVTEIMFGVKGSGKNEKAKYLFDCWDHRGDFSAEQSAQD